MDFPFNHFFNDRTTPETVDVLTRGPLSPHLTKYARYLHTQATRSSRANYNSEWLIDFNKWLEKKRLGADEVDSPR